MRAIVHHEYGGADRLSIGDRPQPVPGKGEVLVGVRAAAVDSGTLHLLTGTPLMVRPYSGLRRPRFTIPGRDLAGVVEACGPGVVGFAVGDEVIGTANGSLAEHAVVPVKRLARKPASLDFAASAAIPVSGLTALKAIAAARIATGDRVLVTGASGGVGSFVVQLAVAAGGVVTGVCSAGKADLVRKLGATEVLDYAVDDLAAGAPYDAVIDIAGNTPLRRLRRMVTRTGAVVIVGGDQGGRVLGGMERTLAVALLGPFVRQRLKAVVAGERGADMATMVEHVERGDVTPAISEVYPFEEAARAIGDLAAGRVRGKAVIEI
ncbi:NAD(P)-dependent alcohol dehydrogenase [Nocardioides marmoriginsengisoli]|uniref:NAD(P)-dependent alcohol dehydrogenase n=1 Tax=Nocardioides marmoriginsengisoli TaxID=661483 RepID=A0A3N0CEV4_9ACTN|nr:NAD(P)-dependent alcohol dehydrogenase [Nocardioides marmoriginsengisoli]RNL61982.1 NAD(P)-dependent alcohol dehydrogenase [Nocardioides marmoriginsengisoli]